VNVSSSMGTQPTTPCSLLMGHVSTALMAVHMSHMDLVSRPRGRCS